MRKSVTQILRDGTYRPLLLFVNETLTKEQWKKALQQLDLWELSEVGVESEGNVARIGKINGSIATFASTLDLQRRMRNELSRLAALCCSQSRWAQKPGTAIGSTWRKALVLPTGERFIEDYGERLGFLAEALEHELEQSWRTVRLPDGVPGDSRRLHLHVCTCGCQTLFTWEGNWSRKQRKFLNDQHRMHYHNTRNIERKRDLARKKRKEGDPKYN
jgi:hypothetical protein